MTIKSMLGMLLVLLLPLGQANALLLSNWNDADLDASGDSIVVTTGNITNDAGGIDTWFSMQWQAGTSNSLTALGIDTVFYNCEGCLLTNTKDDDATTFGGINAVWIGSIGFGGTDVTADWDTNFAGLTSGGGFGEFSSRKNLDSAGTAGVVDTLFFVLNGDVTFVNNGDPTFSTFAAHVRYENDCSGWASDGTTADSSSGSCGVTVPEPSIVWLLGSGLALIGFARRKS